jgi:hypothetical protein
VALDPIVSLSVAIAEAPGSYAFFLGSGVSRDAGVPTGSEVFWQAVGELYRLQETSEETPDREGLAAWLESTEGPDATYSDVLELIAPDPATRREYLAKHFEGVEPGPTHERLANLAADGRAKVFITTNFDRLLEHALHARGIEPVVITSDADLEAAPRREHADCYVLKPHGDYLQQTIRNTPAELAELAPAITTELQEIVDRYGLVVLGYSGSDEGIGTVLRARHSRYGVYWLARSVLPEPPAGLVEAVGGRVIEREGAAVFLADLDRRLAVFAQHPSGLTPLSVHDQVIALLRQEDRVGLHELLRGERREYEAQVRVLVDGRHNEQPTDDIVLACHDALLPALERRLASMLPLVLHDPAAFAAELDSLAEFKNNEPVQSGYTFWRDLNGWGAWWLGHVLGAFTVRERRFASLTPLLSAQTGSVTGSGLEPLVETFPGNTGDGIGKVVMAREDPSRRWISPSWEALKRDMSQCALLTDRYPELVTPDEGPLRSLVQFDFLLVLSLGLRDYRSISHWTMYERLSNDFARRLHSDNRLRTEVAQALDLALEDFDARAPEALRASPPLGEFPERGAISILETGSAH